MNMEIVEMNYFSLTGWYLLDVIYQYHNCFTAVLFDFLLKKTWPDSTINIVSLPEKPKDF